LNINREHDEVFIVYGKTETCGEIELIRGTLWYFGIRSKVIDIGSAVDLGGSHILILLLPWNEEGVRRRLRAKRILTSRDVTQYYLRNGLIPEGGEVIIYGEPYVLLPRLILDARLFESCRGKALLGDLFVVIRYKAPEDIIQPDGWYPLFTSIGCEKRCLYCSYGNTFCQLYPGRFTRRSRPWEDIAEEIIQAKRAGHKKFRVIADQFLSDREENNRELYKLANFFKKSNERLTLSFTLSPTQVLNNQTLLMEMQEAFTMLPYLSIDSFDNNFLRLMNLNHDADSGLKAVQFLSSLKTPLRVHYLFNRPGISIDSLKTELLYFLEIAKEVSYLTPYEKLILAYDFFSKNLVVTPYTPLLCEKKIAPDYERDHPQEFSEILRKIHDAIQYEMTTIENNSDHNLLFNIIKSGMSVLRWS